MSQAPFTQIGRPMARKEDYRFLTGNGRYLDDVTPRGTLTVTFVRSPHAHARILAIRTEAARAVSGVVGVFTGSEVSEWTTKLRLAPPIEGLRPMEMTTLPVDRVRFHGDPVAVVVARDRYVAEDAAELVEVDYEVLPAIASMGAALAKGAALVDEALPDNLASHQIFAAGDVDARKTEAARVVESRFDLHRHTHAPMETRGCYADWDKGRAHLTMHIGAQAPHPMRSALAARLGIAESQVTVISPDMGGGFGQKIALYREELTVAALARHLGRPVHWREDRLENLTSASHARETQCVTRAAVSGDGRILGLELELTEDFGAYAFYPANYMARVIAMILTGPYKITSYAFDVKVVLTNKCGNGPMRAPMAITSWVMDGTVDAIARELGLDPLEVRRVNAVRPEDLPYRMATGEVLEDITPLETLEAAVSAIDVGAFRARQAAARAEGRLVGLGLCTVVESTTYGSEFYKAAGIPGSGHEAAWVRIEPNGAVNAAVGLMGSGQGYESPLAQAVAEGLGVVAEDVNVHMGHTDVAPYGMGSRGGRGGTAGGGTLYLCARKAQEKVLIIAAGMLSRNGTEGLRVFEARIEQAAGGGWEPTGLTLADVARRAYLDPTKLPEGVLPGLDVSLTYDPPPMTYSNATHACEVEIDPATGAVRIDRYVVAEDCGVVLNPVVVRGQQQGAVAMGLSGALFEEVVYDEAGQNLSATLADYRIASSVELPNFEIIHMNTPNRRTPTGAKGMAEGGIMGSIGVIAGAVNDALGPLGVTAQAMPFTPQRLRALIRSAVPPISRHHIGRKVMSMATEKQTVGFIGLGIMGASMAGHIRAAGYEMVVYNRTRAKAQPLLDAGAAWSDSPGEVAAASDVVITIVGYPKDVEEVYLGAGGIVERARDGAILIDMTTSSPELAERIARAAAARGLSALDAPVSGGDVGARAGKLAIMVGGDSAAFERALPILECMGGKIQRMGAAGAGQHTKMANQIAIASTIMGVTESLVYAEAAGLDRTALIDLIGAGAAGSFQLTALGPKIAVADYAPGFFINHFVKDMGIAIAEADRMGLALPGLALAKSLYDKLVAGGFGLEGTQALIRAYAATTGGADAV